MCLSYVEQLLTSVAKKSPQSLKYACVIVFRGEVISYGFNRYCTKFSYNDSYLLRG